MVGSDGSAGGGGGAVVCLVVVVVVVVVVTGGGAVTGLEEVVLAVVFSVVEVTVCESSEESEMCDRCRLRRFFRREQRVIGTGRVCITAHKRYAKRCEKRKHFSSAQAITSFYAIIIYKEFYHILCEMSILRSYLKKNGKVDFWRERVYNYCINMKRK